MFTLDFSESHTTVVCFKAGEGNQSDRYLFSHVKAQEIFTDVVILMMVTQLPQNETFDQDRGRSVCPMELQRSFSPSHVCHVLHCGSVLGIADV